jgi:succinate dehydrogenase/fumarate reductase cytochrome b subunit
MDQHIRNQMSLMAWIMAALCGWAMFLSAHAITAQSVSAASPESYSTTPTAAQK